MDNLIVRRLELMAVHPPMQIVYTDKAASSEDETAHPPLAMQYIKLREAAIKAAKDERTTVVVWPRESPKFTPLELDFPSLYATCNVSLNSLIAPELTHITTTLLGLIWSVMTDKDRASTKELMSLLPKP
jgi:hypothetical protein